MDELKLSRMAGFAVLAFVMIWWLRKGKKEESVAEQRIEQEGGQILSTSTIGMLLINPFKHATTDASGHRLRVRYGERTGTWFVRTSSSRPEGEWLWVDDRGDVTLPVARIDDSRAVPAVRRIPTWVFGLGFVLLAAGALVAASIRNR